jgi:hypothetical protein
MLVTVRLRNAHDEYGPAQGLALGQDEIHRIDDRLIKIDWTRFRSNHNLRAGVPTARPRNPRSSDRESVQVILTTTYVASKPRIG